MLRLDDGTMAAGTTYRVQSSPVQPPPAASRASCSPTRS